MPVNEVQQNKPVFSYEQTVFAGGVSTVVDPRLIDTTQLAYCQNAYPARSGRLRRRAGVGPVGASWGSDAPRAQRSYCPEGSNDEFMLVWHGTVLDAIAANGTRTNIGTGIATGSPIAHAEFVGVVYYSDGTNGLRSASYHPSATYAFLRLQMPNAVADMTFTAKASGTGGNAIGVTFAKGAVSGALAVTVPTTNHILVTLAADEDGIPTSTAAQVKAAVEAQTTANGLVAVSVDGEGSGIVTPFLEIMLSQGYAAGWSDALVSSAFSFCYLAARKMGGRLFGIDAADKGNLRWCNAYAPQTWGPLSVYSPGGEFTAAGEVGQALIATTSRDVYRFDGTDPATWQVSVVPSDGLGCISPNTFVIFEGKAGWWSPRGFTTYDGAQPATISDPVFDPAHLSAGSFPTDAATYGAMFAFSSADHLYVAYSADTDATSADSVMVYDIRMQAWGGPYTYGLPLYCGCSSQRSVGGALPHLGTTGAILRETASGGDTPTMLLKFVETDGARPLMDKIFNEARLGMLMLEDGDVTFRLVVEGSTKREETYTLEEGQHAIRMRVPNARGKSAHLEVETAANSEAYAIGVDCFFVRAR
jgi:hypothetical protein